MFWSTRSPRVPATSRSSRGIRAALSCAVLLAAATAAIGNPGAARGALALAQHRDTIPGGDLRCLTRRAGDCLDEPVPADEPHNARCATCHNLWSQGTPSNVTRSCSDAACHADVADLGDFHKTIRPEALTDCLHCHVPHDFRAPEHGGTCTACHRGGGARVEWALAASSHGTTIPSTFTHASHLPVDCVDCHGSGEGHGTLDVVTLGDCRSCHHRAQTDTDCAICHERGTLNGVPLLVTRSLDIRIGALDRPLRLIPFDHANHEAVGCGDCHTRGSDLRAAVGADCSGCHASHHEPSADCSLCHETPSPGAHDAQAHLGCGAAGCHTSAPEGIRDAPRTRSLCLSCHTDRGDHKPERSCADCHRLPAPSGTPR